MGGSVDQVVDTDTAREFMKETLESVEPEVLEQICAEVEGKAAWFQEKLGPQSIGALSLVAEHLPQRVTALVRETLERAGLGKAGHRPLAQPHPLGEVLDADERSPPRRSVPRGCRWRSTSVSD